MNRTHTMKLPGLLSKVVNNSYNFNPDVSSFTRYRQQVREIAFLEEELNDPCYKRDLPFSLGSRFSNNFERLIHGRLVLHSALCAYLQVNSYPLYEDNKLIKKQLLMHKWLSYILVDKNVNTFDENVMPIPSTPFVVLWHEARFIVKKLCKNIGVRIWADMPVSNNTFLIPTHLIRCPKFFDEDSYPQN